MKNGVKYLLQKILGFPNYLFLFSLFKIKTLNRDKNERDFLHFIKIIPSGGIVLDIGANIGIMTAHLAKDVKEATVYAFEPVPHNLQALKRVIKHYELKNVKVFDCALGNGDGEVEMVVPLLNSVRMQGLSHVVHQSITENNEGERFKTAVKKLDGITEILNNAKPVTGIKIDVENFEFFVLDGAKELLRKHKPVVYCELWDNENRKKCFQLMSDLGYETEVLSGNRLISYIGEVAKQNPTQNFFFTRKSR